MPEKPEASVSRSLREAEARHRQILDSAVDTVIISTDLSGCVTSWNEGAHRIIGYAEAEMLGHPISRFFTPEDNAAQRMQGEIAQAVECGHGEHEGWRVRKDGSRFWASGQMTPIRDEAGTITGFVKIVRDRTLERSTQEALQASQEQLQLAQSAGGIGTFAIDIVANAIRVTPEFCRLYGLSVAEAVSPEAFEALVVAEDRPRVSSAISRQGGNAVTDIEYRIRRADDGAIRWIHRQAQFVPGLDGGFTQMVGVAQDITARKSIEQSLRESEAQFRTLAETMPIHVWTASKDGRLDWFNKRVLDYFGLEAAQLAGDAWINVIHPDDRALATAAWQASLAAGTPYETEFRVRRADGASRWHLTRALPLLSDTGEVLRWIGANTDIEEQKAAMTLLSKSNEALEIEVAERTADRDRMWSLANDLMLVADFDRRVTAMNPAWQRLGWPEAELIGHDFLPLVHPDDRAATIAEVQHLADGITTLRYENRIRCSDGSYRPIVWTAVPGDGLLHAVGRDVTAEKEAAAELEYAHEALRQAHKMEAVGQLTGGIAHDFNNLLTGIIGSLDMMQRKAAQGKTSDVERYVAAAMTSANRAAALTHRLLAFSRRQPLDPKPVNVNRLIIGMEELLRRSIGETINLDIVTADDLWQTRCDPHQLENAILNLAINARDAMPGGGKVTIETCNAPLETRSAAQSRDVRPGEYICICVTDTGSGMSPDVIAKAFDPFFTTKPIGQGTGLGLSMIYGFTRQSEGYARIQSEVDQGTTVKLYLPRYDGEEALEEEHRPAGAQHAGNGEIVLVVEDEPAVRALVVDVLDELGYRTIEAVDGPSGLTLVQSDIRLDLLVTDVGLPGLNGRQLADAARAKRPGLKILFMTGYAENTAMAGGFLEAGMEMITKPFAVDALAQRIKDMVDSK